jgi:hypothetical protein
MKASGKAIRYHSAGKGASPERPARLGDVVAQLMDGRMAPRQRRFESIVGIWRQLLPTELADHCRIVDVSANRLKVLVDSPSYMYELRLCSSAILEELQRRCPAARVRKISFVVG